MTVSSPSARMTDREHILTHIRQRILAFAASRLSREQAEETVSLLPDCTYIHVPGNHVTMLFGQNAPFVTQAILDFAESAS